MTGPVKAFLEIEQDERIDCQFNPADLTIAKANTWNTPPSVGRGAPDLTFQAGQSGTLTLSLTLDATTDGTDVSKAAQKLMGLMNLNPKLPGTDKKSNKGRPPWVIFHWGVQRSFKAVVDRLTIKFTYFAGDGKPLRAKADLSLKQYHDADSLPLQNPTSHTPEPHAIHRVVHGETLDRIAATHYADATRWRVIAEANAVVDPLAVAAGTLLVIPEIPVRRRG